ncbi:MAG: hypothetical protein PHH68_05610 [Candidatus Omnitrophica bacterium]|jgi:hypothetical protein|nr:hypothetical protein [Candidatus Omnitrophota bacterium]MDD5079785.1 hypothetical protein [Candidatus Omnitrophota bacterium]
MKKALTITLTVILGLAVILLLTKNMLVKFAVTNGIKALTGVTVKVESIKVGVFKQVVAVNNLQLFNPKEFTDQLMADIPEIYVDYDLGAFMKGKVHLKELRLNLKELAVNKSAKGKINLESLQSLQPKGSGPAPEIAIDLLKLDIDKVVYRDYSSGGSPQAREFNVNIHEQYENITDPNQLVMIILSRALVNTTIAQIAKIGGPLKKALGSTVGAASEAVGNTIGIAGDTVSKVTGTLKGLLTGSKSQ